MSISSPCTNCKKSIRTLSIQTTKEKKLYIHEEITKSGEEANGGVHNRNRG
jgi:hypothetical protein